MEDQEIIRLLFERDEHAIRETEKKYGAFLKTLARNITGSAEDAEECVNDTWMRMWKHIPPERPENLRAWLGRVIRNLALNRYEWEHAEKRMAAMSTLLSEWEDCIPASGSIEETIDGQELTNVLNRWLGTLSGEDRNIFLRRYWYGDSVKSLANQAGIRAGAMTQRLYRLRLALRDVLEKEGYTL